MKKVRAIFATNFFFQAGVTFFATFFTVFLVSKFHFTQIGIGFYIGYAGIWIVVAQGILLPFLSNRFNDAWLARFSLIAGSIAIFAYYLPHTIIGLAIVGALFALTNGLSMAILPALASSRSSARVQGEILGINASVVALAQAIPPILSGFLAAKINPVAPVYISAGVIAAAWVIFTLFVKTEVND